MPLASCNVAYALWLSHKFMFVFLLIALILAGIAELASLIIIIFCGLKHMPSGLVKHALNVLKYAAAVWLLCLAALFFFYRDSDLAGTFFHGSDQEASGTLQNQEIQDNPDSQNHAGDAGTDPAGASGDAGADPAGASGDKQSVSGDSGLEEKGFFLHVLDVGQGLSVLMEADGHYFMYDGGPADSSSKVVALLRQEGVSHLDYVIASHYDEDHISGLAGVLNVFDTGAVLCPDYQTDTRIYRSLMSMVEKKHIPVLHPAAGDTYEVGGAEIQVLAPKAYSGRDISGDVNGDNDFSVCIRILYGRYSCLITGDAEKAEEEFMIASGANLESDTYIAGHHGSATSTSEAFLDAVLPRDVIISCGRDNPYGHPSQEVLQRIYVLGSNILRTDLQGQIDIVSDGSTYHVASGGTRSFPEWNQSGTGDSGQSIDSGQSGTGAAYVLNIRSHKFHKPDCSAVDDMSQHNKAYSNEDRESLISQGYSPCGICNP